MKTMKINKQYLKTTYYNLEKGYTLMVQYQRILDDIVEHIYIFKEDYGIIKHCFSTYQKIREDITVKEQIKIIDARLNKDIECWQDYINSYKEEFED